MWLTRLWSHLSHLDPQYRQHPRRNSRRSRSQHIDSGKHVSRRLQPSRKNSNHPTDPAQLRSRIPVHQNDDDAQHRKWGIRVRRHDRHFRCHGRRLHNIAVQQEAPHAPRPAPRGEERPLTRGSRWRRGRGRKDSSAAVAADAPAAGGDSDGSSAERKEKEEQKQRKKERRLQIAARADRWNQRWDLRSKQEESFGPIIFSSICTYVFITFCT